jgi:hypothetical protein
VYLYDSYTLNLVRTVGVGDAAVHAAVSLSSYSLDAVLIGTREGTISLMDDRTWKAVPGA